MDNIKKFQDLLEKLFQFEAADLDFGVYRILNAKKDRLEKFIQEDLKNKVEAAFAKHKEERLAGIEQRFNEVNQKVSQGLGAQALSLADELSEKSKDTPLGREYLAVKKAKVEAQKIDEIKDQVFNDLFNFFGRFYAEGDFVPQYRYSIKGHKYAIPYNGEEVKLYWANKDQYYVKTGLLFRDYTFFTNPGKTCKIIFRLVLAHEELGSNKATKERFFVLDEEKPIENILLSLKTIIVRFCYRELTAKEVKHYQVEGGSNTSKQEKINQKNAADILSKIDDVTLKGFLTKEYKNEKPLLLYQISRFAAKNTKDYFIHQNLKKFLSEQLDYFIKAEVLSIETLEQERFLDKHLTRAKVVREIGEDIIDFLAQIEDFQKRLWEKKKFVLRTEYVITCDQVPEEFYPEILQNEEQKKEWVEMGFGEIKDISDLVKEKNSVVRALNLTPILTVDTRYFSPEFKEKLLEALSEKEALDDRLNGILIKSENWQALNLLMGKYREKIQTIYIDPPFNLGVGANFLYNVNYKDSTWISILENRLWLAKDLMSEKGSIFVRCDYNGNMYVRLLMNEVFGKECFRNEIDLKRTRTLKGEGKKFHTSNDTLFLYGKNLSSLTFYGYKKEKEKPRWVRMHLPGTVKGDASRVVLGKKIYPPPGRKWVLDQKAFENAIVEGLVKKVVKNYWNLVLSQDKLKKVLLAGKYKILALAEMLEVKNENDRQRVEEIAILGLKKYLALFYKRHARRFETENIGFFNLSSFYPDFILWMKKEKKQTVVFIDPKGLEHLKGGLDNEKIRLKEEIKGIEQRLTHSLSRKDVTLESFILSQTPYEELIRGNTKPAPKEEYLNQHVLFLDEPAWAEILFAKIISTAN